MITTDHHPYPFLVIVARKRNATYSVFEYTTILWGELFAFEITINRALCCLFQQASTNGRRNARQLDVSILPLLC
jgi:hypothetical protein